MTNEELIIEFSQKYYKRVYRYVKQICHDKTLVADIVQDTFLIAYEKADVLQNHKNPDKWLYATARYQMLKVVENKISPLNLDSFSETLADNNTYEDDIITGCDIFTGMVKNLDSYELRLMIQHYEEGYSASELAEQYHTTPGSIKMKMQRAKRKLKLIFGELF